jgi:outer membrane biosynthesis protein TonB
MHERDETVSRRYREAAKEEPPASLDAKILASARAAVAPKRFAQRWAVPVSLAAVLVLAVGVTLRMQQEQPGIETRVPLDAATPAPVRAIPVPAPAQPAPPPERQAQTDKPQEAKRIATPKLEEKRAKVMADRQEPVAAPQAATTAEASVQAPEPAPRPQAFTQSQSAPVATQSSPPAASPAPAAAAARAPAPITALRASKREDSAVGQLAKEQDARERELERIARLRTDGRNTEADEALRRFRTENPDYRIPDAMWEKVRPR